MYDLGEDKHEIWLRGFLKGKRAQIQVSVSTEIFINGQMEKQAMFICIHVPFSFVKPPNHILRFVNIIGQEEVSEGSWSLVTSIVCIQFPMREGLENN